MNLFQLATRGVDLSKLPDEEAPRQSVAFEPSTNGGKFSAPSDLNDAFEFAAKDFGVDPDVLRAVAYAESRFHPDVVSGKVKSKTGATGLMQFMPKTAQEYGIDPLDPVQSIFGAAAYLRKSLDKFDGDYGKAVASYNAGPNRKDFDAEDWDARMPAETQGYLRTVFTAADQLKQGGGKSVPTGAGAGRGSVSPGMVNLKETVATTPPESMEARIAKQGEFSPLEETWKGLQSGYTGLKQMWEANAVLKDSVLANSMAQRISSFDRIDAGAKDVPRAIGLAYQQADAAGRAKIRADVQSELSSRKDFIGASMETIRQYQAEQQRTKGRTTDLTDVGNLKDFGNWLAFNGASGVVSMAPLMVAAVATGPAAPLVTGAMGVGMATGELTGDRIKFAKDKLSAQRFSRNPDRYDDAVRAENQNVTDYVAKTAGSTVGAAIPFAALDVVAGPVGSLLKGAGKEVAQKGVKWASKEVGKDTLEETATGGLQEGIKILTENALGEQDGILTGENLKRVINSAAAEGAGGAVGGAGRVGYQSVTRPSAPTVESQPTTPTVPPVAQTASAADATQAVDNIAALLKQTEANIDGAATQATPVQPGSQAADVGAAQVDAAQQSATEGQAGTGAVDVAGQSDSAQSLTQPSNFSATPTATVGTQTNAQAGPGFTATGIAAEMAALKERNQPAASQQAQPQIFTGKSALFDGYGASVGSVEAGDRKQLMVDPNGGYFWGDWKQESQRDVGAVAGGADKDATPASFTSSKEARQVAASTPLQAAQTTPSQPAQQQQAQPRAKAQPLLTDGERDMLADFERMYQSDVKGEIKTRLGLLPARQDEATAPAEKRRPSELLAAIKRAGGIKSTNAGDLMGGNAMDANRILPGLFKKDGMNLDLLVPFLKERGYLTQADEDSIKDNGGVNKLAEILQAELSGDRAQTVDSTAGYKPDAEAAMRSDLDSKAFALGLPMKVTNEMSTERLNGVINRIERKLGKPVNTDFATRKMSRTEAMAERQAILMADRVERARAQYDADIQAFAEANDRVQEAVLDVMVDEDGNIEIIYESTVGEAYDNRNVQEDSGQAGAPVTQGARTGAGNPEANRTEAGAGQEGLTSYTSAEVTARQNAAKEAEATAKRAEDAASRAEAAAKQASEIAQRSVAAADTFELGGNAEDNLSGQEGLRFSSANQPTNGITTEAAQKIVDGITAQWKNAPEVVVLADLQDVKAPKAVRDYDAQQRSQGAEGEPEGFWYKGKAYVVAGALNKPDDVARVLMHEALGHYGLRGVFGDDLKPILRQVAMMRQKDVAAKAEQYGLDVTDEAGRLHAAEEVLAEMAQSNPDAGVVKRAIAAIRAWMRKHIPGFRNMVLTDADIISNYLLPARNFVVNGGRDGGQDSGVRFQRGTTEPMPENKAPGPQGDAQQGAVQGNAVARSNMPEERDGFTRMYHAGSDPINGGYWQTVPSGGVFDGFFALTSGWGGYGTGAEYFSDVPSDKVLSSYELEYKLDYETVKSALESVYNFDEDDFDTVWKAVIEDKSHKVDDDDMLRLFSPFSIGEASWEAQRVRGLVADKLGYQAVEMDDENGTSYLIVAGTPLTRVLDENEQSTPTSQGVRFSRGAGSKQAQQNLALNDPSPAWMLPASTKTDALVYELQDQKVDLKRTQEAIKAAGRTITEPFDARMAETLMPGRVAYRTETFLKTEVAPLMEAMAKNNVTQNELSDYLLARHAPERNAQIAKVNPEMPDGGAGTNSQGVLMTTQAAQDHIAALTTGKRMVLQLLANKIDAITASTRDMLVREGLEKQSTMDAWTGAYKHYVPLFKDEAVESPAHPIGSGMSVTGSASKRAMGSEGEVTNMVAHILMQREAAITRAEKNRVAMSLYGLALSNPNQEVWTTIRPNMRADKIGAELAAMGVDPVEAEQGMQGVPTIRTINAVTGLVQETPNPMYKRLDNALVVKVDGEDRVILFNAKNTDAMNMARALKNQDGITKIDYSTGVISQALGFLSEVVGASANTTNKIVEKTKGLNAANATRYLASINTQYNPAFGMVNVVRDIGGALVNLTTTGIADKKAQVFGDIHAAMKGIARDVRGDQARTPWSDLWVQFQEDGGRTGYRDLFIDPFKRAEAVQKDLDALQRDSKASAGKAAHLILDLLDDFNTTLENGVRLSAYKAALDKGMSRPAAAKLARELTVDFNRKGRMGREIGPLYAFFNASVQGTARTIESLKGPAGKKIIAGGLMIGVIQSLMLAWAGFDDDEPPEFVKARAFIIPMGDKRYIAIPLQFGLNALPNTGRVITDLLMTGGKDAGKKTFDAIGEIMGSFNPLGGGNIFTAHGLLTTVAPTVADPAIDIGMNTNFSGSKIGRDRADWDTRPGFKLARESTQRSLTGQAYIGISKAVNALSGGNEFKKGLASPTPEQVQYVFTTTLGGLYRELEKGLNIAGLKADGFEIKARMIPLGGRFAGEADDQDTQRSRYYRNSERLAALEAELKGFEKDDNEAAVRRIETERSDEVDLLGDYKHIRQAITKLNKLAADNINDMEMLKELDAERLELMRELNDSVRKLEKRSELFKRD